MRLMLACVVVLALSACGSSSGQSFGSAQMVAVAIADPGCTSDADVISDRALDCEVPGTDKTERVNWFSSSKHLDAWRKVAEAVPGNAGEILVGPDWAVECASVELCRQHRAIVGGELIK